MNMEEQADSLNNNATVGNDQLASAENPSDNFEGNGQHGYLNTGGVHPRNCEEGATNQRRMSQYDIGDRIRQEIIGETVAKTMQQLMNEGRLVMEKESQPVRQRFEKGMQ